MCVCVHPPTHRICQGSSAVCFPLQREDTLNKSDGRVYFLHVDGRETQDWFYPLPGNGKVSRRPLCQGKGTIERRCDTKKRKRENNLSIKLVESTPEVKFCILQLCVCVCLKMIESSQSSGLKPNCITQITYFIRHR